MKAIVRASLLALVLICLQSAATERDASVKELEKRLAALTNAIGNLQLTMVEVYCEQCPIALKKQNRELAPYLHIAGRFTILREGLFQTRDSLRDLTALSNERQSEVLLEVARFEARLRLSEASIKALEPGSENPLFAKVEEKLESVYAFFKGVTVPKISSRELVKADIAIMWKAAHYLSRSPRSSARVRQQAEWAFNKLAGLKQNKEGVKDAALYALLDEIFEHLQPNYLLLDQFGMENSLATTEEEERLRESVVNLLGASEMFAEHSRSWAQTEFAKRRHTRLGLASAEAKSEADPEKAKVLALFFHSEVRPFRPSAAGVDLLKDMAIGYIPEDYVLRGGEQEPEQRLLDHPSFAVLNGKPGVVFINYKNPESTTYRRVVAFLRADDWDNMRQLREAVQKAESTSR